MLTDHNRKKLRTITRVYWFLLIYIITALVWWFISLMLQTAEMRRFQVTQLNATIDSTAVPEIYRRELAQIHSLERRSRAKYIGEGVTFLGIIILGSGFVYRAMRRQIRFQQQQQHFMMAVTHELKTPIAITRLNLETMIKHRLDEQKQQKLLQNTLQENERLNTLTNNILISSQLEGGGYRFSREQVPFSELLAHTMKEFANRFQGRQFSSDIAPDCILNGDSMLLQLLISNLVENAVKYSPKTSVVQVQLERVKNGWNFSVKDEGVGIPEEEKDKVFEKFYRVGNENTRTTKGTGLGLFLCRKIAADHRATISITANQPAGSIFTVNFQA